MGMQTEEVLRRIHEEQWHLLEYLDVLVHVIDLNSLEIVRANKYSKNILGDVTGKICWQAFHAAQKGPCSFCPRMKLLDNDENPQGTWQWEMQNTRNGCWYEMIDKAFHWVDGRAVKLQIAWDITKRKRAESVLRRSNNELENCVITCIEKLERTGALLDQKAEEHRKALSQMEQQATELGTIDIALKVMLDKYRQQEIEMEEKIVANIKYLIFPHLDILGRYLQEKEATVCLGQLREKLIKLSSPFSKRLSTELLELTPREIQIAGLVKEGRTNKEIAAQLNLSTGTVECFRDRLREKLGIKNTKRNLRSFLLTKF